MTFVIPNMLPDFNDYSDAERDHRQRAAKMKRQVENVIMLVARSQHHRAHFTRPVYMKYTWVERNRRRDKDNISFARKFVQDAFVKCGILNGDGWKYIVGFSDRFLVDPKNPHVEVEIIESEES